MPITENQRYLINQLPTFESLTPEQKKQEQINIINDWAKANPSRVLGDDFYQQRQYLTPETWKYVVSELNLSNDEILKNKKIPDSVKSTAFNNELRERTNEAAKPIGGVLLTGAALPVMSAALPLMIKAVPVVGSTLKWGLSTPAGQALTKKIIGDALMGTAGYMAVDEASKAMTGKTVGQNLADLGGYIPIIKQIPYNWREGIGNFANPGVLIGGGAANKLKQGLNHLWNEEFILAKPLLNLQLPKAARNKIFTNQINYNNSQLTNLGFQKNLNIKEPIYKIEPLKNFFRKDFVAAYYPEENIIRYSSQSLNPFIAKKIGGLKGITGHEIRHAIQKTFGKIDIDGFAVKNLNQKPLFDQGYNSQFENPLFEILSTINLNSSTKSASDILTKANGKYTWKGSLNEFDAEMARLREQLNIHKPYIQMPSNIKKNTQSILSKRFNIAPADVDAIAKILAMEGYKSGGKLSYVDIF